jgi:peptidoglycan/LPS O-acetylase OafA/YrhL
MADTSTKPYFKNFDGLRAIAATLVFIWHVELHKHHLNTANIFIPDTGFIGVTIFLVLSGFLITYLLMHEKDINEDINYKKFYMRRVLRIWPLYFLILLTAYFIYPANMSPKGLLLGLFFLPNFAILAGLLPAVIDPIWSIGVEEQFYLVQPHIIRLIKKENIAWIFILLLIINYTLRYVLRNFYSDVHVLHNIEFALSYFRFDCLIIGSLMALFYYNEKYNYFNTWATSFIFSKTMQVVCLCAFIAFITFKNKYPHVFDNEMLTVIAAIIIVNLAQQETSLISLNNKFLNYLGRISYGFYLLHKIPLFFIRCNAGKSRAD